LCGGAEPPFSSIAVLAQPLGNSVMEISGLSNSPAAQICRRGFREHDATRKHPVHPIALMQTGLGGRHDGRRNVGGRCGHCESIPASS
jgi:hypothetical protein